MLNNWYNNSVKESSYNYKVWPKAGRGISHNEVSFYFRRENV